MKVILLNTTELTGGAAIAANRLMKALIDNGIEAKTLVLSKKTTEENVISIKSSFIKQRLAQLNFLWERWVIFVNNRFSRKNLFRVSIANTGFNIAKHPLVKKADIIHIHWINQGLLSLKYIKKLLQSGKPIVWTMHDMWPCTGICHHARECNNYQMQCHDCFYLDKPNNHDLSYQIFNKKKKIYQSGKIIFITCSRWLKSRAEKSALLSGQAMFTIPNPIDTSLFFPMDKTFCRKKFNLSNDKKIILFGAVKISDDRKGIHYLIEAIELLSQKSEANNLELVIFGKSNMDLSEISTLNVNYLNFLSNVEDIIAMYNTADVYVTPSLEENLPNTIMESLSCGVPCVGFNVGGIPEMINHKSNGYISEYESAEDLAAGIYWTLFEADYEQLSQNARQKVIECYSEKIVAEQYINLYKQLHYNS